MVLPVKMGSPSQSNGATTIISASVLPTTSQNQILVLQPGTSKKERSTLCFIFRIKFNGPAASQKQQCPAINIIL